MMRRVRVWARCGAVALCCGVFGALPVWGEVTPAGAKAFSRIFVENRCFHRVDLALERGRGEVALAPVAPRKTEMVLFAWTRPVAPDERVRLSRKGAVERWVPVQAWLNEGRHERWVMGRQVVDSWFVTVCARERPLDDPAGATVRPVKPGETVAEYEMLFSRVPGSVDPMYVFAGLPVEVWLNGVPLRVLKTGRDGMLRFLLPVDAAGTVVLESRQGSKTLELGRDWQPVRMRRAFDGEKVLVEPVQVGGPQDW